MIFLCLLEFSDRSNIFLRFGIVLPTTCNNYHTMCADFFIVSTLLRQLIYKIRKIQKCRITCHSVLCDICVSGSSCNEQYTRVQLSDKTQQQKLICIENQRKQQTQIKEEFFDYSWDFEFCDVYDVKIYLNER